MLRSFRGQLEKGVYPTTLRLPLWARPMSIQPALRRLSISEIKAKLISETFLLERGLRISPLRPEIPPTLSPIRILPIIREIAPIDGVEVVEWMHISAAENTVLQARILEYNSLGSQIVGANGDPYIPGVVVENIRFLSELGSTIASRGYSIVSTPRGNFNVPNLGNTTGVFRDLISWASTSYIGKVQTVGTLLKWRDLAQTPITQPVGFFMDLAGNVAPHFFVQQPPRPALTVTVRQIFSSDKPQTIKLNFRDPTNYSNIVGTKSVAIAAGTSEVTYTLSSFPYVPPLVAEIKPQDGVQTRLESYTVS